MDLVLTLPGLFRPSADQVVRAPNLAHIVGIAGPPERELDGLDAMLAAYYGIEHSPETDCPLAPIRVAALGVDPGTAYWLAADPVTLIAGRDDVRLTGTVRDLDAYDVATLIRMLNAHFITDEIEFVAARPDAWFVRAPQNVRLRNRPLAAVTSRMLRDLLPIGPDAGTWRRWQNEIQMLMHEHPVNVVRERDGKAPANSVWFSEGGTRPARLAPARAVQTFADAGAAVALASHVGRPARAVPGTFDSILADSEDADVTIVVLTATHDLDAIERAWTSPVWTALLKGKLNAVTLLADDANGARAWTARRPGPWRRRMLPFVRHDLAPLFTAARDDT
jgi:hypothetical protein